MATISRDHLSGSTDGKPIALAVDSGTYTTVHTGPTDAAHWIELWLYFSNITSAQATVTVAIGGTADANKIKIKVPAQSTVLGVPGWTIQGNSGAAITVTAATTTAAAVNCMGHINLIDGS